MKENLTQYEQVALNRIFNLADGHAHQSQTNSQGEIIGKLTEIFERAQATSQELIEKKFCNNFYKLAGQFAALDMNNSLLCYSASSAIQMVAHLLKQKGYRRTALIEPTFDNLADMLRRSDIDLVAIEEDYIFPTPSCKHISDLDVSAIFIVVPNNPTGKTLNKESFKALVNFCAQTHTLLIVDFCFRFFDELSDWDQYALAIEAGIDFIFIEDTGKTWPTLDLKASIISCSSRLFEDVFRIHNELLLNISPFTLEILSEYIRNSQEYSIERTVTSIVSSNRNYLQDKLTNSILKPSDPSSRVSVEWLEIVNDVNAEELWETLKEKGVFVLPGTYFYWTHPDQGKKYIRIALMRDSNMFREAVDTLVGILSDRFALASV